jgi:hypothetical protein
MIVVCAKMVIDKNKGKLGCIKATVSMGVALSICLRDQGNEVWAFFLSRDMKIFGVMVYTCAALIKLLFEANNTTNTPIKR